MSYGVVRGRGCEMRHLAKSQSEGFGAEIRISSSSFLVKDGVHMESGSTPLQWFTFSPSVTEPS